MAARWIICYGNPAYQFLSAAERVNYAQAAVLGGACPERMCQRDAAGTIFSKSLDGAVLTRTPALPGTARQGRCAPGASVTLMGRKARKIRVIRSFRVIRVDDFGL